MKHQNEPPRILNLPAALLAAALITLVTHPISNSFAQEAFTDEAGTEVLTRGPVHEAFAGVISYEAVPGVVVAAAPPELIEEIPPGERPVGDDVTWIPGYWAWDDERNDFLWVSGIWRALPPGREWIVGYWAETTAGYQWTSGYWADAVAEDITYLPAPPRSLEEGPNIAAPSSNHGWTPGCWIWSQERYAWSPGYWAEVRPDWDWMPAHYVWTRRGHVFVDGYWDHSVQHRGVLFAPVYFDRGVYSRPGYSYSPSIVIDLGVFASHLFLRPNYDHYYFGDYYAPRYRENGFFASFSFHSSRRGYDSIYARQRWEHRDDRDWEHRHERDYQFRRDDESARPPHTWAAQSRMDARSPDVLRNQSMLATSLDQLSARTDSSTRFQSVDQDDRQLLAQRGKEVQKSREKRRDLEVTNAETQREGGKIIPSIVPALETPIAAKANDERKGTDSPPERQRGPRPQDTTAGSAPRTATQPQPGNSSKGSKGRDMNPESPQEPGVIPQPPMTEPQPGRLSTDTKGRDMKPGVPQEPGVSPQLPTTEPQPGRLSTDTKGRDMKPGAPQEPGVRPQLPTTESQPGRPAQESRGREMIPDAPQVPQVRPQLPVPQPQPGRPAQEGRGRQMKPEAPQVPQVRPQQPAPQQQPSRPAQESRTREMKPEAPQLPQVRPQQAPSRPQPARPAQEERGRDKKDEEQRGRGNRNRREI